MIEQEAKELKIDFSKLQENGMPYCPHCGHPLVCTDSFSLFDMGYLPVNCEKDDTGNTLICDNCETVYDVYFAEKPIHLSTVYGYDEWYQRNQVYTPEADKLSNHGI